jgi:hypothetical protein
MSRDRAVGAPNMRVGRPVPRASSARSSSKRGSNQAQPPAYIVESSAVTTAMWKNGEK